MGGVCSSSNQSVASGQDSNHKMPTNCKEEGQLLSAKQLKVVQETWAMLDKDMSGRGIRVFQQIFTLAPETKGLFNFRYIPDDELHNNLLFKAHAGRFMQIICAVMDNANDLDTQVKPTLHNLGQAHVVKFGVNMEYFDLFKTAMLSVWSKDLGKAFTVEAREAWTIVFEYVLEEMKVGFVSANHNHSNIVMNNTESASTQMADEKQVSMEMADNGNTS
uniref:Globin gb_IVB n=1 Tax=Platynereis dumerilii TaxID=6359 RepID=A0A7T8CM08_PLADU|nr:globin gb_IVB [Platynereis dumerilii]